MSRWLKISLITTAIIFGLLLSSMVIVPWQIKKQGGSWIATNTERTLTIEKAFFNPFTLTIEISGSKLTEQNSDQTFIAFKRLMLSGSVKSIIKQAIIFDRVELDDAFVNIELLGKQDFNFSDFTQLGSNEPKTTPTEQQSPLHFSFNNIILSNGSIDFTDQTSAKKSRHKIRELSLNIPVIGNIPYLTNDYVEPLLRMLLNGSEIKADGQLKPFHDSLETNLYLSFDNIDLAYYAFHSPIPLPIDVNHGILSCNLDLSYRVSKAEQPKLMLGGKLTLADIELRELNGQKLFRMPKLLLDLGWANLFTQELHLTSLDIREPQLFVDRNSSGLWNFERIIPAKQTAPTKKTTPSEAEKADNLPLVLIERLTLIDGQIHLRDDFVSGKFSEDIHNINLELENFSTHQQQKTVTSLKLQTDRNFTINLTGDLGINPPTATMNFVASSLPLKPYYPYLASFLSAPLEGLLHFSGDIIYTKDSNLLVQKAKLNLDDLLVPFGEKDQLSLAEFKIADSSFDLQQQMVKLGSIELNYGVISATKLADGRLSPLLILKQQPAITDAQAEVKAKNTEPWEIGVESVDLQNFKLLFTDASLLKKPKVNISDFNFHIDNLSYPNATKSPFILATNIGKKGSVNATGTVIHTPLQLQAKTKIKAFSLVDLNDFIPENININLTDGKFYSNLAVNIKQQADKLSGNFSGEINISSFNLRNPHGEDELLAWKNLNFDGISGEIAPPTLHIKEIALSDYLARIEINTEGKINLANLTTPEANAESIDEEQQDETANLEIATDPTPQSQPLDIRIDTLTLQGGTVSFTDNQLQNTFYTTMYNLGGRVTGLASDDEMKADVDLRGQLENHSPLTISGKVNPLSADLFADITLSFKDIDLTPMTPYSGTYVGYEIDKGKLYLDLNYHIEQQKITATNKVMIDQLTFGDSIDSDQATSLPVTLAIALLKDSSNEIHLNIPISGDLNDPDFSIGGVILTVLKNLLVKAATSPFALLGSMLGGDEDFTGINFASGITTIDAEQLQKLSTLATMLAKRPALTLEISGFADRKLDPEGYRADKLKQMLLAVKLKNSGTPKDDVLPTINPEEYHDLLLAVYKKTDFPRPRNFIGILVKLPDSEMEKLLLSQIRAGEERLQELAKKRMMAVRDALVAADETIKPRLFFTQNDIYQLPKKGAVSRVEFNISSK